MNDQPAAPAKRSKKSIFLKLLAVMGILLLLLIVVIAMQPAHFEVQRSRTMPVSAHAVYEQVVDLHHWDAWSPWAKMDPDATIEFTGAPRGEGSAFTWSGNDEIGEGTMTITHVVPNEQIDIELHFVRPFAGKADVQFTFAANGDQTVVTWSMSGENNFIGKAISLVMNCDDMIGPVYEKGLASLEKATKQSIP